MKILLISPCKHAVGGTRSRSVTRFPQISLLYIAACTPAPHEVEIVEEEERPIDFDAACDLVGITCMTANAPRAYVVAAEFRRRGKRVVLGGVHPTVMPEEAARHADAVVVGEAEPVWGGLLADAEAGRLQGVYRSNATWRLDDYPLPLRPRQPSWVPPFAAPRTMQEALRHIVDGVRSWPVVEPFLQPAMGVVPIVTSRGCPYSCEFCSVHNISGRVIRHVAVPRVLQDIERSGARRFMFLDDNIVGDQSYAEQLFDALRGTGIQWVGQASLSFVSNERLLEKAAASGCKGLFVGLESVTERALEGMRKGVRSRAATAAAVRRITRSGILFHASIVFGFDDDEPSVFDETLEFLQSARIASATFNILTPYPGTALHERFKAEGRLLTSDWRDYDHCTPTFVPRRMSLEQLLEGYRRVREGFFGLGRIAARLPANWRTPLLFTLANLGIRAEVLGDRTSRAGTGLPLTAGADRA
jgi:radical SAM superfamily enzyme YgiQ (UPF0313 family)